MSGYYTKTLNYGTSEKKGRTNQTDSRISKTSFAPFPTVKRVSVVELNTHDIRYESGSYLDECLQFSLPSKTA